MKFVGENSTMHPFNCTIFEKKQYFILIMPLLNIFHTNKSKYGRGS
jgi:hypothetical protein